MQSRVETIVRVLFVVIIKEVGIEFVVLLVLLLGWTGAVCATVADTHEKFVVTLVFEFSFDWFFLDRAWQRSVSSASSHVWLTDLLSEIVKRRRSDDLVSDHFAGTQHTVVGDDCEVYGPEVDDARKVDDIRIDIVLETEVKKQEAIAEV